MKLITKALKRAIPPINFYDDKARSEIVFHAKLFTPWTNWTWYIAAMDENGRCFGLVEGFETEIGYFDIRELEDITGPGGLKVERDLYFDKSTYGKIVK